MQGKRNHVVDCSSMVKEIDFEDVLLGSVCRIYCLQDYLIIADHKSTDNMIHLFDLHTFDYIKSTAPLGRGPGEITNMGNIAVEWGDGTFYLSDHGKRKIFRYDVNSLLGDSIFEPDVFCNMSAEKFPSFFQNISDSTAIATVIQPTGHAGFNQIVAIWDRKRSRFKEMKYSYPDLQRKRVTVAVSPEQYYVECYEDYDLMTICDWEGNLKWNVFGSNWREDFDDMEYYRDVVVTKDFIIASYVGETAFLERNKKIEVNLPKTLIVFSKNGDYIQTLYVGYGISDFCYDSKNNRLLFMFNDEIQSGYLNLEDLL